MSFEIPTVVFNAILLCLLALAPIVVLVVSARPDWGDRRAHQVSVRARLPFGTEAARRGVRTRLRHIVRGNMWSLLAVIAVVGVLFIFTPLASSAYAMMILTLLITIGVLTGTTVVLQVRERLFLPAPAAPRIARPIALRTRDYIGPWRLRTPALLLAAAGALTTGSVVVAAAGAVRPVMAGAAVAALVLALAVAVAARLAERRVLAQPQPASDTLELAWDDLFRSDALSNLRLSAAMTAWLPLGLAVVALISPWLPQPPELQTLARLFPWWGVAVLQVMYTAGLGQMPDGLYPAFLRAPIAPVGSPA